MSMLTVAFMAFLAASFACMASTILENVFSIDVAKVRMRARRNSYLRPTKAKFIGL